MSRYAPLFIAMFALLPTGCAQEASPPAPVPLASDRPLSRPLPPDRHDEPPEMLLFVQLRLASIEVPIGQASGSEDIWSYLNEEPLGAELARTFGLNGLRVGRGQRAAWPELSRTMERLTGRKVTQGAVLVRPGGTVQIPLKTAQPSRTLFTFYPDRTLSGTDVPAGDAILNVSVTLDADRPDRVLMTVEPQVRSSRRRRRLVNDTGWKMLMALPDYHAFAPLTFQMAVPVRDFLVIGPGSAARRPYSVGGHFLVKHRKGMPFETVIVLIPEVVQRAPETVAPPAGQS